MSETAEMSVFVVWEQGLAVLSSSVLNSWAGVILLHESPEQRGAHLPYRLRKTDGDWLRRDKLSRCERLADVSCVHFKALNYERIPLASWDAASDRVLALHAQDLGIYP